jgi:hypothetical protein
MAVQLQAAAGALGNIVVDGALVDGDIERAGGLIGKSRQPRPEARLALD